MIHATSESDITSLATSSPRSSPATTTTAKPPAYYVQSPSRDSHDEDKSSTSASATATLATCTPVGYRSPSPGTSPSLLSLFSRQSRLSSSAASRVSGGGGGGGGGVRRKGRRERARRRLLLDHVREAAEEEEEDREVYCNWWKNDHAEELSRSCKVVLGFLGLGLLFFVTSFIIWGASRPFTAQVYLKRMTVHNYYTGEGADLTGVPTKMVTLNSSLRMRVYNPATFFGIHVSFSTIILRYYDLTLASAHLDTYYQPKRSWRTVIVNIRGTSVALYGAGAAFEHVSNRNNAHDHGGHGGVPLMLDFEVRSQGNLVGKLVKSKHSRRVACNFTISPHTTHIVKFGGDSCPV